MEKEKWYMNSMQTVNFKTSVRILAYMFQMLSNLTGDKM